jgi:hypothetical protein
MVEYLTSRTLPDGALNKYFIDMTKVHEEILSSCFTYMFLPIHNGNIKVSLRDLRHFCITPHDTGRCMLRQLMKNKLFAIR